MGIFTDFYNTVARFFRPQEEVDEGASKSVATNRLKLVLMQDRTNLTPKILEQMRGELVDLLSKYLEMDKDLLELNFEQEGDQVALMLSIPVIRAKDEEEIEAALAATAASEEETDETEAEANEDEEIEEGDETTTEENAAEEVDKNDETEVFDDQELVEEEISSAEVEAEIVAEPAKKKAKKEKEPVEQPE